MFELTGAEAAVSVLWVLGVLASLASWPRLDAVRHRVGLVLAAVVLPVVGSLAAFGVLAAVAPRPRRRPHRG